MPLSQLDPYWQTRDEATVRLYRGDALEVLERMPSQSVHCAVTSPPYWNLRDYQTGTWKGGNPDCDHIWKVGRYDRGSGGPPGRSSIIVNERPPEVRYKDRCGKCGAVRTDSQIGAESHPDLYVSRLVEVFRELRRVLRDDATFWLDIGDTFGPKGDWKRPGMVGIPHRLAFALQDDGWILAMEHIHSKPCPMTESVTNRCTKSHNYVFMFVKKAGYFFDQFAIREKATPRVRIVRGKTGSLGQATGSGRDPSGNGKLGSILENGDSRNKRSVWEVSHGGYKGAHFACVDAETEALTKCGWKKHAELVDGEEIAAYDQKKDCLLWQKATIHRYDYDDELVAIDKRDTSQWLTPNHRCLVMSRKHRIKTRMAYTLKSGDHLLMTARMEETPETSIGEDMASLAGWYTSEGHRALKTQWPVRISQSNSANPENVQTIKDLLHRMGAEFKVRYRTCFAMGAWREDVQFAVRGCVARSLLSLCSGKEITHKLTRLPFNELEKLLAAFISGDGHRRLSDGRQSIIQKSRRRLEMLQIMAIKIGYRAHLSVREDGMHVLYLTEGRWLDVRGTNGAWSGVPYRAYKGVVWCPSVRSEYWMARRDGKPFITGNTFPPALILPCIKAGTSEKGCCMECGAPWKRVVERTRQATRPGENSKITDVNGTRLNGEVTGNRDPERHVTSLRHLGWYPSCKCYGLQDIQSAPPQRVNWNDVNASAGIDGKVGGQRRARSMDQMKGIKVSERHLPDAARDAVYDEWVKQARELCRQAEEEHGDSVEPCVVLDPFIGSGTTAVVCIGLGRYSMGIDLSEEYLKRNAIPRIEGELLGRPALASLVPR